MYYADNGRPSCPPSLMSGITLLQFHLIRKGIRNVLKAAGYMAAQKRRGLAANLASYLDSDRKAAIDWADAEARAAQLKVLVQDAEAVLELAQQEAEDPEVRAAAWLLTRVLGDDVESDEHGDPQIADGIAPDPIVSMTDPEMRHGRKSAAQRFDGRKVQAAADQAKLPAQDKDLPSHMCPPGTFCIPYSALHDGKPHQWTLVLYGISERCATSCDHYQGFFKVAACHGVYLISIPYTRVPETLRV
jgi:hypothetical protein